MPADPTVHQRGKVFAAIGFTFCCVAMLACGQAHAQDYDRIAPQPVPGAPVQPEIVNKQAPAKKSGDPDAVILPELKGLDFVQSVGALLPYNLRHPGVDIASSLPFDQDLRVRFEAMMGQPLTLGRLNEITSLIVDWYRNHNRPVVDVVSPKQDISNGIVQIIVIESHAGKITVDGNQWFTKDQILDYVRQKPGELIDMPQLQDDAALINQNPFRHVDVVLNKGDQTGTTDIEMKAADRLPLRAYVGYDNYGVPATGRDRWSTGFNWGDAFWHDQQLSYQFTGSDNFWINNGRFMGNPDNAHLMAHALNYTALLPWRDRLEIFGSYERERPDLGADFGQIGHSAQASMRYDHPLPNLSFLSHEIFGGYDFKTSDNNLEFGGEQVFQSSTDIHQFVAGYRGTLFDDYGQTIFENSLFFSPGDLSNANGSTAFQQSGVQHADSTYVYDRLEATRLTPLPYDTGAFSHLTLQAASSNLLPSEQLGAGGINSVRGYTERVAEGSQGVLFSQEWRSPVLNVSRALGARDLHDTLQGLLFWDYARVSDPDRQDNQRGFYQLQSLGIGARYSLDTNLEVRGDYGWQLAKAPGAQDRGSVGFISVMLSY